jgi:TolA-binding protein
VRPGRGQRACAAAAAAAALLACGLAAAAAAAPVPPWTWELSTARYQKLNLFERAQYDKAAGLVKASGFKAAAGEFEKFKVQFPDSDFVPYALFMRGYCLHMDKTRNAAIQLYDEVLDFFADQVEEAAPARYFKGVALLENGDAARAVKELQALAADERTRRHPLAASALRQIAQHFWQTGQGAEAAKYWKQVVPDFGAANPQEAERAAENIAAHYVRQRDPAAYEASLLTDAERDNAAARRRFVERALAMAWGRYRRDGEFAALPVAERQADMLALWRYAQERRPWFEKDDALWSYYAAAVPVVGGLLGDAAANQALVDEALALLRGMADKKAMGERAAWLVDRLIEVGDALRARQGLTLLTDAPLAAFKEHEIAGRVEGDWDRAARRLADIEKMGNEEWAARALGARAGVYKDRLGRYEDAIALYRQINQPPRTLWGIQEAFWRWHKLEEALATLTEIENFFPDDAPNAAWQKALYLHQSKERKRAVAAARRVLAVYPKSSVSSLAHQLLEEYGVKTGGGTVEE